MKTLCVTYKAGNERKCEYFFTHCELWKWLADYRAKTSTYPASLCVYECECLFDGG